MALWIGFLWENLDPPKIQVIGQRAINTKGSELHSFFKIIPTTKSARERLKVMPISSLNYSCYSNDPITDKCLSEEEIVLPTFINHPSNLVGGVSYTIFIRCPTLF